ncbi:Kinesin-like protein kif17 [Clonorchis sinensis]|uniref:Kinesin-like protein n=1 Tax=Clonorchis sinensis TaxID=79923 RepID=A0A3R7CS94_CLOSI|nr:Kinesin-like protein kif17 [Clonorchis sinensis]
MAAESVRVIVRCRPLNTRELELECKKIIEIVGETGQCSIKHPSDKKCPPKNFFFDGAFDMSSTTEQIYSDICYPLVEGVTEGYNGTIFAYGQTGCGKSFTMQGLPEDASQRGIIPRAFDHVFETISVSQNTKFLVYASFLEIYNEEIRDLLARDVKTKLDLKEHPEKGVYVAGLSVHKVSSVDECQVIMGTGWKNRSTGATLMNAESSRSHSIFTIHLEMIDRDPQLATEKIKAGKLNLVDLAGSERQAKTGAAGDRLREATKINLSLSALGNVISALVDAKVKHIPYRDSKLTRLLQDSLGGNTKTLMIACLSPADNNYDETLSTLRYANRAKNIQNKPKINEDPKDALLRQYQDEIARLRQLLEERPSTVQTSDLISSGNSSDIFANAEERERLRQEYETKLREKEAQYNAEAADKAKLLEEIQRLRSVHDSKFVLPGEHENDLLLEESRILRHHTRKTESVGVSTTGTASAVANEQYAFVGTSDSLACSSVLVIDQEGTLQSQDVDDKFTMKHKGLLITAPKSTASRNAIIRSVDGKLTNRTLAQSTAKLALESLTRDELLERLSMLEAGMVGGEEASNPEIRARHSRRQKYAEERRRRLEQANAALEDEGIMVGIYETIQEELCHKNKLLQREKQKNMSLRMELSDIQSEFEQDRSDYLDTIRRQQRQMDLLQAIIDRIQPCIRRDSNYYNVDKIKRIAKFDEEKNEWVLPQMTVERTHFPLAVTDSPRATADLPEGLGPLNSLRVAGVARDMEKENEEEARYYAKLASRTQSQPNYFANRRANQLLIDAAALSSGANRAASVSTTLSPNIHSTCFGLGTAPSDTNTLPQNSTGALPGALDDVFHSSSKRHSKFESRLKNSQSPTAYGKQNSPSYRKPK